MTVTALAFADDVPDDSDESERDFDAAVLDARGKTTREIAAEMGYKDRAAAMAAVQRGQLAVSRLTQQEVRARHLIILRSLLKAAMTTVANPGPLMDRMGTVVYDEDDNPLPDETARMNAVDKASRLMEREAKLVGADAPTKSVNANVTLDPSQLREYLLGQGITAQQIEAVRLALMSGERKALPPGEVRGR